MLATTNRMLNAVTEGLKATVNMAGGWKSTPLKTLPQDVPSGLLPERANP